ncbi:MAG TPA: hypothetical protein VGN56_01550 [Candidatus Paceibacterota bacterium]|jgi:hypothetical protein|nr:hypothetical protein [Candidatus Paceibacterota bacterium]
MSESFNKHENQIEAPSPEILAERARSAAAIAIQPMLALRLYKRLHPETDMDELHPKTADLVIRREATELWMNDESGMYTRFREYWDNPQSGSRDVISESPEALDQILDAIGADSITLH